MTLTFQFFLFFCWILFPAAVVWSTGAEDPRVQFGQAVDGVGCVGGRGGASLEASAVPCFKVKEIIVYIVIYYLHRRQVRWERGGKCVALLQGKGIYYLHSKLLRTLSLYSTFTRALTLEFFLLCAEGGDEAGSVDVSMTVFVFCFCFCFLFLKGGDEAGSVDVSMTVFVFRFCFWFLFLKGGDEAGSVDVSMTVFSYLPVPPPRAYSAYDPPPVCPRSKRRIHEKGTVCVCLCLCLSVCVSVFFSVCAQKEHGKKKTARHTHACTLASRARVHKHALALVHPHPPTHTRTHTRTHTYRSMAECTNVRGHLPRLGGKGGKGTRGGEGEEGGWKRGGNGTRGGEGTEGGEGEWKRVGG
jgi:hypothetical protein